MEDDGVAWLGERLFVLRDKTGKFNTRVDAKLGERVAEMRAHGGDATTDPERTQARAYAAEKVVDEACEVAAPKLGDSPGSASERPPASTRTSGESASMPAMLSRTSASWSADARQQLDSDERLEVADLSAQGWLRVSRRRSAAS